MALIHLKIVTPQGLSYDDEAQRVIVRTATGDVCILPRHIDYAATLNTGAMRLVTEDGQTRHGEVDGGMLHVENDNVQIITNRFSWKEEA